MVLGLMTLGVLSLSMQWYYMGSHLTAACPIPVKRFLDGFNVRDSVGGSLNVNMKANVTSTYQSASLHPLLQDASTMRWKRLICADKKFELFAYTAHYDDREYEAGIGPAAVRIMSAARRAEESGVTVLCLFWYGDDSDDSKNENDTHPEVVEASRDELSVGISYRGRHYQEYLYSCPMNSARVIPTKVSLVCSSEPTHQFLMPVEIPARPVFKKDFAVCVCATYGHRDPYQIIEWMELQRLWGAEKVIVYNHSMDAETARTLVHFAGQGIVDFRQSPPFLRLRGKAGAKLHQTPTINDCIYRNMHSYHKILVIDFDEMIVPLADDNFTQLLRYIDNRHAYQHEAKSYVFRNAYFFFELPEDRNQTDKLVTLRHRTRLSVSKQGYAIKSIVDPQACLTMHNHYCWKQTKHHARGTHTVYVHRSLGLNFHYKPCHYTPGECRKLATGYIRDDTMLRFQKELIQRVIRHYAPLGLPGI